MAGMPDEERRVWVQSDYEAFLTAGTEILAKAAKRACEGRTLELTELFEDAD